eukprot:Awhi_evm1s13906
MRPSLKHQLQYLEKNYGSLAANLNFESIHKDTTVANYFRLFLSGQFCCEILDCYEKILEYESLFRCSCQLRDNTDNFQTSTSADHSTSNKKTVITNNYDIAKVNSEHLHDIVPICSNCTDRDQILMCLNYIIKEFLSEGEREVNLPAKIKSKIKQKLVILQKRDSSCSNDIVYAFDREEFYLIDQFLFAQVKDEVRELLEQDLFKRFSVDLYENFKAIPSVPHKLATRADSFDAIENRLTYKTNILTRNSCNSNAHRDDRSIRSSASLTHLPIYRRQYLLDMHPGLKTEKPSAGLYPKCFSKRLRATSEVLSSKNTSFPTDDTTKASSKGKDIIKYNTSQFDVRLFSNTTSTSCSSEAIDAAQDDRFKCQKSASQVETRSFISTDCSTFTNGNGPLQLTSTKSHSMEWHHTSATSAIEVKKKNILKHKKYPVVFSLSDSSSRSCSSSNDNTSSDTKKSVKGNPAASVKSQSNAEYDQNPVSRSLFWPGVEWGHFSGSGFPTSILSNFNPAE